RASMEEKNIPQEELDGEKGREEYSFLQEVIKDETVSIKRLKGRILRLLGSGIVFGVAASVVFCILTPWFEARFHNNPAQVEIPKDEEEQPQPESEPAEGEKEKEKKESEEESYCRMLQTLNTEAIQVKRGIVTVGKSSDEEKKEQMMGGTTGILVADNGRELLILSDIVSAKEGEHIAVTFPDGSIHAASEKMRDPNLGLCVYAVLREKIDKTTWSGIEIAEIGNSNLVNIGDTVIVLGRPYGTDDASGYGVVAVDKEYVELADGVFRLISTNITGNDKGSGAIFNRRGQLVGVISQSVLGMEGNRRVIGYGISDIKSIIELLSNGSAIPYTGICGMDVTEELNEKGMPQGIYVKEVEPDSPAMAAGIQSGDVIIGIEGQNIISLSNYHSILVHKKVGTQLILQGLRQGAGDEYVDIDFNVTVGSRIKTK
ncbi:MAG: serine protease, partial [Dorea sp.]|nr:serine protease [Dorea sp.]